MSKKFKCLSLFSAILIALFPLSFTGCDFLNGIQKGRYFVNSEYISASASLTGIDYANGVLDHYVVDIHYETEIELNYISYQCNFYKDSSLVQTLTGEVKVQGIYKRYIPLKITFEFDETKVFCTGYSDQDPKNFAKIN